MTTQPQADESSGIDPRMKRRAFLKAAAGTTAVAAVGGASMQSDRLAPVGESEAIGVTGTAILAGVAGVAIGAGGTYLANELRQSGGTDETDTTAKEQSLYDSTDKVLTAIEPETEYFREWYNSPADDTPFARAAWREVKSITYEMTWNGASESEIRQAAGQAVDEQYFIAQHNIADRIMGLLEAQVSNWVTDYKDDNTTVYRGKSSGGVQNGLAAISGPGDPFPGSEVSGGSLIRTVEMTSLGGGVTYSDVSDRFDDSFESPQGYDYPPAVLVDDTNGFLVSPHDSIISESDSTSRWLIMDTSDRSEKKVFDVPQYHSQISTIKSDYESIKSDLDTFVSNTHQAIIEGDIEETEYFSATDLYSEFSVAEDTERHAVELAAIGADVPADVSTQAEVSHPDIESDSLWGNLFVRWAKETDPIDIQPGTVISSGDYRLATLQFENQVTGETDWHTLSGSSDLTVLDTEGESGERVSEDREDTTAGKNSEVVVWDTTVHGEAPQEIRLRGEYGDLAAIVYGAENKSTHTVSEITEQDIEDGTQYLLESTSLNAGEAVEEIRITAGQTYESNDVAVSDPTTIDQQAIEDQIATNEQIAEALEELGDDGGGGLFGGGLFGGGGLPTLPGLGVVESVVVVVGGLFTLSWLRG